MWGNVMRWFGLIVCALAIGMVAWSRGIRGRAGADRYDIVVYGGTSAGVAAAVQARRMDKTVVIVAPRGKLGGMTSSGLGWTDTGRKDAIGGFAREFYRRIKEHYDRPEAWRYQRPEDYRYYRPDDDAMWTFEPHVAEAIFEDYVRRYRIPVLRRDRLVRPGGVLKRGTKITAIRLESGRTLAGRVFIDCSYEGDLMAEAGVQYVVGREANSVYGETINGVATRLNVHAHRFLVPVDPYRRPGDPSSGLLPGIDPEGPGREGEGDHRVQAYNYRLCLTDVRENQVPFRKPEGYDPLEYELLLRNFEAGDHRLPIHIAPMPNRKTDVNNLGAVSTDYIGRNYAYPDGSYEQRAEIERQHELYIRGLMWTLAHHPRVPAAVRREVSRWGWAKDEFVDNDHFPFQIYVREARRMVGTYVMTEHDCCRRRIAPDSVGLGSYNMDSHNVQRYVTEDGTVQNEGDVQETPGGPYVISYRSLLPKADQCSNLLVPVCLSASHAAYGSIRMEPVFMILGQSAATAAALALDQSVALHELDYSTLRRRLLADGQVLDLPPGAQPYEPLFPWRLPGIVVDETDAELSGSWRPSRAVQRYVGRYYMHDGGPQSRPSSARYRLTAPNDGTYRLRISYTPNANRATNVPVVVELPGGRRLSFRVNQRLTPSDGVFHELTQLRLSRGSTVTVYVSNRGCDGYVIIDAVQLLPVDRAENGAARRRRQQ